MSVTDSYTSNGNTGADATCINYGSHKSGSANGCLATADQVFLSSGATYGNAVRDSVTLIGTTANLSIGTQIQLKLYSIQAAGTYTVSVYTQSSNAGATPVVATPAVTWTVTVSNPDRAASTASTATVREGDAATGNTYWGGTAEGTDSQTLAGAWSGLSTVTTPDFTIVVNQKSATSTNTARESYTVTVTGEAYVTAGTTPAGAAASYTAHPNSTTGLKSLTMAHAAAGTPSEVHIWSTGTAGTATVTLTTFSGVAIGTKTFTFGGDAATIAVGTVYKKVLRAAYSLSQTDAFTVTIKDSAGNAVNGLADVTIVSSDPSQITSGSCSDTLISGTTSGVATDGTYLCSVTGTATSSSGKAVTLTIRTDDPSTTAVGVYLTTTLAVTMGGAVSTVVLTTDKATYEPGEVMTVTATAKDSSGNTPYDQQSGPSLSFNKAAGSAISMSTYINGVSVSNTRSAAGVVSNTSNLFAPTASGKFTVSGLDGQTTAQAISVTATVADDAATAAAGAATDAALEAIDAANAATDAANLAAEAADAATVAAEEARDAADAATAAVEALATEVATLMAALKAQITTLANTVAKIAKKVKA